MLQRLKTNKMLQFYTNKYENVGETDKLLKKLKLLKLTQEEIKLLNN